MLVDRARRERVLLLSGLSALVSTLTAAATLSDVHVYDDALMESLLVGTLGFDIMTLVVSVVLGGCLWAIHRRRDQYWMLWLGLQGYVLYTYAIFAFGLVYTRFYFLYIAIVALSAYALAGFALHADRRMLRAWRHVHLPRRTMGLGLIFMAGLFTFGWSTMLAEAIAQREDIAAAITLAVAAGEFLRPIFGEALRVSLATPYLLPGAACLAFAVLAFRRVAPAITHAKA